MQFIIVMCLCIPSTQVYIYLFGINRKVGNKKGVYVNFYADE